MPINKGDRRVPLDLIKRYQSLFRNLDDWKIEPTEDEEEAECQHNAQTCFGNKVAGVFPCPATWNGEPLSMEDYTLHEILHALFRSVNDRETEELAVQDLCKLVEMARRGEV